MRILFVSDRRDGGIVSHVRCLQQCLPSEVETFTIGKGGDEEFAGKCGHDLREFWQMRRVIKAFRPDIVHFHIPALLMVLYVRFFAELPIVRSWHTPATGDEGVRRKFMRWLFGPHCYYLPVSARTWKGLKRWCADINGEVFLNPIRITCRYFGDAGRIGRLDEQKDKPKPGCKKIIGMIGRNAEVKDWSAFSTVCSIAKAKTREDVAFWGVGITGDGAVMEFGEAARTIEWQGPQPNGREWIGKMDVFVLTSKREEMPTVVLECFAERTAVCGFIPKGGMSEILAFSNGALREVFIKERDAARLAGIAISLTRDEVKRKAVVEDGWQILVSKFDAEKNCKGQLMDIYRRLAK